MRGLADRRAVFSCALLAALLAPATMFNGVLTPDPKPINTDTAFAQTSALPDAGESGMIAGKSSAQAKSGGQTAPPDAAAFAGEVEAPSNADAAARSDETPEPTQDEPAPDEQAPAESVLENNQVIVFYGTPLSPGLGILGRYEPEEAAERVKEQAAVFDGLNGDRGAVGAMDLIYSIVQAEPTDNGLFLSYLPDEDVERYIDLAEEHDLELFLDLQIGRGDVVDEVRKIERFLLHPRVHVAVDPEYAVGPDGWPISTPGRISGEQLTAIQAYVSSLVKEHRLPPKMVVMHQYLEDTVVDGDATTHADAVEFVVNMDGIGGKQEKRDKYNMFAHRPYAKRDGFNIFLQHDDEVFSESEVLSLDPQPDIVFYQ